jgi:hypothetical protein
VRTFIFFEKNHLIYVFIMVLLLFSFAFVIVHDYAFAGIGDESSVKSAKSLSITADKAGTIHADIHHLISPLPEVRLASAPVTHRVCFTADTAYADRHPATLLDPPISA